METSAQGITPPAAVYEIAGRRFEVGARGFADAVAEAHAAHQRPRCMCLVVGVEMYVARLGGGYIVKRMPGTGSHHAPDCPSYEPPAEFSGLGQVLGSAIIEDPAAGETTLKLDFPLTKMPGRSTIPPTGSEGDSVSSTGTRLSLRGLLHYLWDQAELTRWHPGFAGKRTWATVRRHLLHAAEHKIARGEALLARLYVPEPFSIEERDAINSRRLAQWQSAVPSPGKPQQLMLLICEVKEIVPARYGCKAIVKHIPDQAFAIDERLYRRLGRRFEAELALWGASDDVHMVMIATFGVCSAGLPAIHELSLMPVTAQWLPIKNSFEHQLVGQLVADRRSFIKGIRYHLQGGRGLATAVLTDSGDAVMPMFIGLAEEGKLPKAEAVANAVGMGAAAAWIWRPGVGPMPPFPPMQRARSLIRCA
ncbi:DUF1173 domain-containing protein [Aquabacterium sp. J223]|uniref:DUF1173 domain-containing protein n=1 Tax=Aquabacterium sp. J223 TaxID=2898431 RepID=UPI0021AD889B|nr:DUF1173 domain-containing protein [Aquabacterium sp. J223]UUX96609.1 DUF1173 domain-containing protein [Aquabacterium sp. J223]